MGFATTHHHSRLTIAHPVQLRDACSFFLFQESEKFHLGALLLCISGILHVYRPPSFTSSCIMTSPRSAFRELPAARPKSGNPLNARRSPRLASLPFSSLLVIPESHAAINNDVPSSSSAISRRRLPRCPAWEEHAVSTSIPKRIAILSAQILILSSPTPLLIPPRHRFTTATVSS